MKPDRYYYTISILFSISIFVGIYIYLKFLNAPDVLNKSVANTSIILISLSMLLTSLCYFWDFADSKIIYRKFLGIVGFLYGIAHLWLSIDAFYLLFSPVTWQTGRPWPWLFGLLAMVILMIMALISNKYAAYKLGGILWRKILRTGYVAIVFVWIHVYLIRVSQIESWFNRGMSTPPPLSLFMLVLMSVVVVMRLLLWASLVRKRILKLSR